MTWAGLDGAGKRAPLSGSVLVAKTAPPSARMDTSGTESSGAREKGRTVVFVSEIFTEAPACFRTPLQEQVYQTLEALHMPFERVDTDEAISMEDCLQINQRLQVKMVKTLFLCHRRQTRFYLFITTAEKPFSSKDFSQALGIPRVSFAAPEQMESLLGVTVGAATVFGVLRDGDGKIEVIVDRDVVREDWYGCSDGTTTGYMKLRTAQVLHEFLRFAEHPPKEICL